jgi:hypothetical protein
LADGRVGLLARDTWPGVALLSAAAVAGHLVLFVVAARVAGSQATIAHLLPPLVLALLAMGLPVNIGGWGPREAVSTLAFGAAGLGATQGLTVAVVYGVLTLVSSLPGAVVRFRRRGDWQARPAQRVEPPDDPLGGEAAARGIREPAGQLGGSGRATARVLPTAVPRSRQGVLLPEMVTRGADLDGVPAARACRGRLPALTRPGRHRDQPSRAWMGSTANIDCGPPHSPMMMALVSSRLRAIARETVAIAERGSYRTTPGDDVIIGDKVARAVANTRLYQPDDVLPAPTSVSGRSTVEIANESSLAATQRLGGDIACLVFASARNPGGGFLNGAQAQEESLARGSGLYPCLRAAGDFYGHHRAEPSRTSPTATA